MNASRIESAAADWFEKRHGDHWSPQDQAELDRWLSEATAHRVAYVRLNAAWQYAARLKVLGAGIPRGQVPPREPWADTRFLSASPPEAHPMSAEVDATPAAREPPVATGRLFPARWASRGAAIAASALLAAAAGGLYLSGITTGESYATPIGGLSEVHLTDGSRMTLNTDTRVRVTLSERERQVRLERGEAFFDVANDKSRPFIVQAGDKRVLAVGTQFSVRREADDVQVIVTEGAVKVGTAAQIPTAEVPQPVAAGQGPAEPKKHLPAPTLLRAGSMARASKSEVLVKQEPAARTEEELSWRTGYLVFRDTPLAEAVREFNRYNTEKMEIEGAAIEQIRIGGNFRANNPDMFLKLMQDGFPIAVRRRGAEVVLTAH